MANDPLTGRVVHWGGGADIEAVVKVTAGSGGVGPAVMVPSRMVPSGVTAASLGNCCSERSTELPVAGFASYFSAYAATRWPSMRTTMARRR